MSHIVIGAAASHSTLMNTHWDAVEHMDRAIRFRDSLADANRAIIAAKPDCAVIIGSNHFRGMYLDLVPTFTIGVGECIASGESGTPAGPQDVDTVLALHIADAMMHSGFDPAFSALDDVVVVSLRAFTNDDFTHLDTNALETTEQFFDMRRREL